jgi:hypothetical protein
MASSLEYKQNLLSWNYKTSFYNSKIQGYDPLYISIEGRLPISFDHYDLYLKGFVEKYKDNIVVIGETDIVYPTASQPKYSTIISMKGMSSIEYLGPK